MDRYTKTVLTIIAAGLIGLAVKNAAPHATAKTMMASCGSTPQSACFVQTAQGVQLATHDASIMGR